MSLVSQTIQSLDEGIRAGQWKAGLPSERELSKHLQVSRTTIRAALEELQRKGWLNVSNRKGRSIVTRRATRAVSAPKKEIAVLSPRPHSAMTSLTKSALDMLREKLAKAGYITELHVNAACFSGNPARALEQLVRAHPSAVWVVLGSKEPPQRWFIRQRIPCLILGSCAPEFALPSLDVDLQAVCRHAGGVFLRKGHRQLALVLPQNAYAGDVLSEAGFREALASVPDAAPLRVIRHDGTTAHLCFLLDAALRAPDPPTAFLVAPALQTLTVMMHLMGRGKRIPRDVAVISRGDDPVLEAATPVVARYVINPEQFARRLSSAVRQLAETGALPAHAIRMMPAFFPGETITGPGAG
ncbi:MAG TPA: substrate-binding domain-containing protein [Prosthecobacter sp.]|nr:substrate-binding domain-containing protein [Prosthecobacter sp.]